MFTWTELGQCHWNDDRITVIRLLGLGQGHSRDDRASGTVTGPLGRYQGQREDYRATVTVTGPTGRWQGLWNVELTSRTVKELLGLSQAH